MNVYKRLKKLNLEKFVQTRLRKLKWYNCLKETEKIKIVIMYRGD